MSSVIETMYFYFLDSVKINGKRIKECLKDKKVTQADMSEYLSYNKHSFNRAINEGKISSFQVLIELGKRLDINPYYFLLNNDGSDYISDIEVIEKYGGSIPSFSSSNIDTQYNYKSQTNKDDYQVEYDYFVPTPNKEIIRVETEKIDDTPIYYESIKISIADRLVGNYVESNILLRAKDAVVRLEKNILEEVGRDDLAEKVSITTIHNNYYDILSFDRKHDGIYAESHIKVKCIYCFDNNIEIGLKKAEIEKYETDKAYKMYCLLYDRNYFRIIKFNTLFYENLANSNYYRIKIRI